MNWTTLVHSDSCESDACSWGSGGVHKPGESEPTDEHEPMSFDPCSDEGSVSMKSDSSEECPSSSDDQSDLDSDIDTVVLCMEIISFVYKWNYFYVLLFFFMCIYVCIQEAVGVSNYCEVWDTDMVHLKLQIVGKQTVTVLTTIAACLPSSFFPGNTSLVCRMLQSMR